MATPPESRLTRGLMENIRRLRPTAYAIKLSDRFSFGVPDLVYINSPKTLWVEVKYQEVTNANHPILDLKIGPQLISMIKLARLTAAYYLIYIEGTVAVFDSGNKVHKNIRHVWATFWRPSRVKQLIDGTATVSIYPMRGEEAEKYFEEYGAVMLSHKRDYEIILSFLDYLGR